MADKLMDTTTNTAIIPEVWSQKYYDVLLDRLPFNELINHDYEGEIADLGDIVNISSIPEFDQATLLPEGAKGDSDHVTISGQQLTIDSMAYKDVLVTKKAQLQSLPFMDGLRDKMIFSILKKIQADIITAIVPSASSPDHQIAYDSGSTLALADILEAKELLDVANNDEDGRSGVMGSAQWNDIFNITGFISRDFIPAGSPLTSGSIPTPICGFLPKMTNVVGSTSRWFHKSFMTLAIQDALNIKVYDPGASGLRGHRVNIDTLYGIKLLDSSRVVSIS